MVWIRRYKQKELISKISVDSYFTFSSYAWLCVFHCSHRLLCWIKSHVWVFVFLFFFLWKLLSFHTEMISAQLLWGSVLLTGVHHKYAKNSHLKKFESALYLTSVSMPLIQDLCSNCDGIPHNSVQHRNLVWRKCSNTETTFI